MLQRGDVGTASLTSLDKFFNAKYGVGWKAAKAEYDKIKAAPPRVGMSERDIIDRAAQELRDDRDILEAETERIQHAGGKMTTAEALEYVATAQQLDATGKAVDAALLQKAEGIIKGDVPALASFYEESIKAVTGNAKIFGPVRGRWDIQVPAAGAPLTPAMIAENQVIFQTELVKLGGGGFFGGGIKYEGIKVFLTKSAPRGSLIKSKLTFPVLDTDAKISTAVSNLTQGTLQVVDKAFKDVPAYTGGKQAWFNDHLVGAVETPDSLFHALLAQLDVLQGAHAPEALSPLAQNIKEKAEKSFGPYFASLLTTNALVENGADACFGYFQMLGNTVRAPFPKEDDLKKSKSRGPLPEKFIHEYSKNINIKLNEMGGPHPIAGLDDDLTQIEHGYNTLAITLGGEWNTAATGPHADTELSGTEVTNKDVFNVVQEALVEIQQGITDLCIKTKHALPANVAKVLPAQKP